MSHHGKKHGAPAKARADWRVVLDDGEQEVITDARYERDAEGRCKFTDEHGVKQDYPSPGIVVRVCRIGPEREQGGADPGEIETGP